MKFFEAVPDELFSPLASPNRALYADALDVLYTAYQDKLKIPEDTFYSMLRSRLEQQLADATFEGEDIRSCKSRYSYRVKVMVVFLILASIASVSRDKSFKRSILLLLGAVDF